MALPARTRQLLYAAFLLSGGAALVFEVVWTRLLLLEFGATSLAVATVLAAFMGGMALGSAWAPRLLRGGRRWARRCPSWRPRWAAPRLPRAA
jgi:spermidine synthase